MPANVTGEHFRQVLAMNQVLPISVFRGRFAVFFPRSEVCAKLWIRFGSSCGTIEGMSFPQRLLGADEKIVLTMRPSAAQLLPGICGSVLILILAVAFFIYLPASWRPVSWWVVIAVTIFFLIGLLLIPFLRWRATSYTLTTHRFLARHGLAHGKAHDIPLAAVSAVSYRAEDSKAGWGTLEFTIRDGSTVVFSGVPHAEECHGLLVELIASAQHKYSAASSHASA
ncbi:hypothetical protein ACU21_08595 [Actinobaculum suis]|nr:hypothetical protein ACU20_08370 [Actinobaculum suis]OCA94181.1 hypothetical protein ACU21_08595 [Actinobaculum suis]